MSTPNSPTVPTHHPMSPLDPLASTGHSSSPSMLPQTPSHHPPSTSQPHFALQHSSGSSNTLQPHYHAESSRRQSVESQAASGVEALKMASGSSSGSGSGIRSSTSNSSAAGTGRNWYPTPRVPVGLQDRHFFRRISPESGDTEERNRWLSEDEGAGGIARSIGRRRRRSSQADNHGHGHDHGSGPSGSDSSNAVTMARNVAGRPRSSQGGRSGDGSSEFKPKHRPKTRSSDLRPGIRRVHSFEPQSSPIRPSTSGTSAGATDVTVGAYPPRIEDIIPDPASPVARRISVATQASTISAGAGDRSEIEPVEMATRDTLGEAGPSRKPGPIDPLIVPGGSVPDFAKGRGGDGIGGINMPTSPGGSPNSLTSREAMRKDLLEKLRRVLGCALCPPKHGITPSLHHPITLPCGHTLSAAHISVPAPPPLKPASTLPHDIFAAQQRQHLQRLKLWSGVMCPIPGCKRYSPTATTSVVEGDIKSFAEDLPSYAAATQSRLAAGGPTGGEVLPSGVTYYPPPMLTRSYSEPDPVGEKEAEVTREVGLLDITVDKVLSLVTRELERKEHDLTTMRDDSGEDFENTDSDGSEGDDESEAWPASSSHRRLHSTLSGGMADLGQSDLGSGSGLGSRPSSSRRRSGPPGFKRQRNTLRSPQTTSRSIDPEEWPFQKELAATVECDVCAMMLYEPVTTPCQHSFCLKCLSRSLDHSSRCPVCRQELPSYAFFQDHSPNRVLLTIIKTAFPAEYVARQKAFEREERDARLNTPIFVCTLAFPGMPTILHVFEPRYRLMIRRCIESSTPRFGMVLPSRGTGSAGTQGVMEYGTMLEIQSVQMLPDGRSMVETVGTHRFRLLEKGNLDGYTVGRIERIDDISPEDELALEQAALAMSRRDSSNTSGSVASTQPGLGMPTVPEHSTAPMSGGFAVSAEGIPMITTPVSPAPAPVNPSAGVPGVPPTAHSFGSDISQIGIGGGGPGPVPAPNQSAEPTSHLLDEARSTEEYMDICRTFIDQLRSGSAPWLLQRLNSTYGTMPTDPSEFSYWMALVMPIDEYEKAKLLPIRSPRLRLKLIVHWVESLRSSWWFSSGCVVG